MHEHMSKRWVPVRLVVVATITLAFGLAPLRVTQAENNGASPQQNADNEEQWCQTLGGSSTTETTIASDGVTVSTYVDCDGGLLDGMSCDNEQNSQDCILALTQPPRPPVDVGRAPVRSVAKAAIATPTGAGANATPITQPPSGG